jgi:hypothetical protein
LSEPRRNHDLHQQPASNGTAGSGGRSGNVGHRDGLHPIAEPADLEHPGTEWPEPEWPDPAWPGWAPGRPHPTYWFTLAASPWFKQRYPDQAANLWDALHAGRSPRPTPESDKLADREAGE